ncbi:MAG: type IV pilus modification protein PilV [Pseudomonadales bacterium]|jgi:type IV pilus assembly protein PilV|nr:type IV pilus modification protein PilV [Pseudomonadales bacterium]HNV55332.1 type IV pilus modification protein PilV [Pseudomonadales bacterium]
MHMKKSALHRGDASGFSLIEGLVALVIFSIGLLGMAGLHSTGMRINAESWQRARANNMAMDILDRIRANRDDALANDSYLTDLTDVASGYAACSSACGTAQAVANNDLRQWKSTIESQLPAGKASIEVVNPGPNPVYVVTVQWDESRGAGTPINYVIRSEL